MEGVINVLKPPGMTSSDVVTELRRIFNEKRVGHMGTLDPGAAGVLPVCIGRATRLFDYLVSGTKTYIGEISFGKKTDTQDSYGSVVAEGTFSVTESQLKNAVSQFTGPRLQKIPMYSAAKYMGKKLYELARKNISVEDRFREIEIHEITVLDHISDNRYLLEITCSKGTYIRTLMEDIGTALNANAHLSFLLRTKSGQFSVEDAFTVYELVSLKQRDLLTNAVIPMDLAVSHLPAVTMNGLEKKQKKLLFNGAKIELQPLCVGEFYQSPVRVYDERFMGIGVIEDGFMRMELMLGEFVNE